MDRVDGRDVGEQIAVPVLTALAEGAVVIDPARHLVVADGKAVYVPRQRPGEGASSAA
jgi:hypothetical protein